MFRGAAIDRVLIAAEVGRLLRFLSVGVFNTIIGFCIVALLEIEWGFSPFLANACGIIAGIGCGFVLNTKFVFNAQKLSYATFGKYIVAFAIALGLEQLLLAVFLSLRLPSVPAQGLALVSYSLCYFCLCRTWIFVEPQTSLNLQADHAG